MSTSKWKCNSLFAVTLLFYSDCFRLELFSKRKTERKYINKAFCFGPNFIWFAFFFIPRKWSFRCVRSRKCLAGWKNGTDPTPSRCKRASDYPRTNMTHPSQLSRYVRRDCGENGERGRKDVYVVFAFPSLVFPLLSRSWITLEQELRSLWGNSFSNSTEFDGTVTSIQYRNREISHHWHSGGREKK